MSPPPLTIGIIGGERALGAKWRASPHTPLIIGTGLEDAFDEQAGGYKAIFKNAHNERVTTPYGEPSDALKVGTIQGVKVVLLSRHGRNHGIDPTNINYRANAIMLGTAVSIAGYGALAWIIYKTAYTLYCIVYPHLIATPRDLKKLAGARWAVVTGATDGIGKGYAFELAHKGFDLILVSRTQQKLDSTAEEIKKKHGVEVRTIAFDFTATELDVYEKKLLSELAKYEIGVLVNNVGLSFEYPERYDRVDGGVERLANVNLVNTMPVIVLSAAVLKQMVERNRGIVVNVSSAAAYHTLFYWSIYSASKLFINHLSAILRKEFADTNIVIQTVCPMLVATNMSKVRKTSFFVPSADKFARCAVKTIGNIDETNGCFSHELQCQIAFGLLPKPILDQFVIKDAFATRKRALKKKADAQKAQ